ncbi:MAG TPA: YkgJ family cysteine cluster protein [Methylomirabilota bacterium]|nr:YkgJ family cysteine cluster protein [Methylomirabilota bacterium]
MRKDRILLRSGYLATVILSAVVFVFGFGISAAVVTLLVGFLGSRLGIYLYFERLSAYNAFRDFQSGRLMHECIACGASCHLKVNLGKDDAERILSYAEEKGMKTTVIEKRGNNYWLKRKSGGACIFLTYEGKKPRCSIYSIRPVACRLYPLIPSGRNLKVDPLCPGLSVEKGHTFKEHLVTQEVGSYVRRVLGRI